MKRIIIKLGVFLLLGAIVNVVVAWGCAQRSSDASEFPYGFAGLNDTIPHGERAHLESLGWTPTPANKEFMYRLRAVVHSTFGVERRLWLEREDVNPESTTIHLRRRIRGRFVAQRLDAGFPFHSLRGEAWANDPLQSFFSSVENWIPDRTTMFPWKLTGQRDEMRQLLPLLPIWPGFAINTLFYATILCLLFAAAGRVRRWRRIRRGLCAKCAYPVGASDVCTECGASVKERSTIPT